MSRIELIPEDVTANSRAYAGDHVAASVDRAQDTIDYRAMLARVQRSGDRYERFPYSEPRPQTEVERELRMGCSVREFEERISARFGMET